MTELTKIAISALVTTPIMVAMAAAAPQVTWFIGVALMLLGTASAVQAYLDWHDPWGYAVGVVAFVFGVAAEFATAEGLVYLTASAVIINPIIGAIEHYG